jgi:GNAT superfamily N-acetyltransferase
MNKLGTIRFLEVNEVGRSLEILSEAARWTARFGSPVWLIDDNLAEDQLQSARVGELVGGFAGQAMTCTMRLQGFDPIYWPDAAPGEALYLHKLAVQRDAASQGWPAELVRFAVNHAHGTGAPSLRLDTLDRVCLINLYEKLGFATVGAAAGKRGMVLMQMTLPR